MRFLAPGHALAPPPPPPPSAPAPSTRHLGGILLLRHLLHPLDMLAFERLLHGDMDHRGRGRRAVPVLLAGWKPDGVASADFAQRPAPGLRAPGAGAWNHGRGSAGGEGCAGRCPRRPRTSPGRPAAAPAPAPR